MISVNELRAGTVFKEGGDPYLVVKYSHVKMGRGNAVVKVKAKGMRNGSVIERSFLSGSVVEEADVEKAKVQFLYRAAARYVFMDSSTYDQIELTDDFLREDTAYLKEGESYELLKFEGSPVSLVLPTTVVLKVTETGSGFKGDTVAAPTKAATLETGLKVNVPLFIETDDVIKVDTRDGSYVNRA